MGMLAWPHAVPRARQGRLLLSVLAVVLIRPLRWAWECSDYSNDDVPGLAGGQHRATALLSWGGWNSSGNLSPWAVTCG